MNAHAKTLNLHNRIAWRLRRPFGGPHKPSAPQRLRWTRDDSREGVTCAYAIPLVFRRTELL